MNRGIIPMYPELYFGLTNMGCNLQLPITTAQTFTGRMV